MKLQAEDNFVLKLVQLDELLFVRHSVFVIGNAGTGKTQVRLLSYQTLARKRQVYFTNILKKDCFFNQIYELDKKFLTII